jgi:hypothetical protein
MKEDPVNLVLVLSLLWYVCKVNPKKLTQPALATYDGDF